MKSAHWFVLSCAFVVSVPSRSDGLGIRIADQDARATARGNAFNATADNPSAIYYNPAGISFLYAPALNSPGFTPSLGGGKNPQPASGPEDYGVRVRLGLYAITLGSEVNLSGGRGSFDISHRWQTAPNFYVTWKPEKSAFAFGLGIYAPYGFGVWYPENSPIRTQSISGNISYMSINPVVSYQVTETLSIAVGPTFNYGRTGLKRGIFPPAFGSQDQFEFEGDGWSVGLNAGVMWRPLPKHSFGLTYRSQTDINFEGNARTVIPGLLNTRVDASAGIKFPQNIVLGYSFRPTEKWNLEFNIDWTDWDNLNTVNLATPAGAVPLPFNWQSSLFYEFGASYRFDNGITASLGYIFSENSVPDASFNPTVPDSDRHIFSAGIGKSWNSWDFDLAYQWAHGPERTINQGAVFDGSYQFDSHAISLSASYRF
ncbi:MAG: outer membrane protein transport protein [Chthoniobacteraceae bacterium]